MCIADKKHTVRLVVSIGYERSALYSAGGICIAPLSHVWERVGYEVRKTLASSYSAPSLASAVRGFVADAFGAPAISHTRSSGDLEWAGARGGLRGD